MSRCLSSWLLRGAAWGVRRCAAPGRAAEGRGARHERVRVGGVNRTSSRCGSDWLGAIGPLHTRFVRGRERAWLRPRAVAHLSLPVDSAVGGAARLAFERSGEAGVGERRPACGIVVGGYRGTNENGIAVFGTAWVVYMAV